MRSRGRCSGSGRRTGLRRSKACTLTFSLAAAAICALVSASEASSSMSASRNSSCSSSTPRSADCPNFS